MIRKIIIVFLILVSTAAGSIFYVLRNRCIDLSVLENYNPGKPSILLDDTGAEWGRFQLDRREPVSIDKIPKKLIQAFLAAEDWQFFEHSGISFRGIARSICVNLYNGRIVQGASTITQQLVKLLFFGSQRTFERKFKELIFAIIVEKQFTKEQILETYLNHVYLGQGIYGIQAACQRFWNKDVSEISLSDAATLASIVKSPAYFCPLNAPLSAQRRRNVVLNRMLKLGYITAEEYEESKREVLQVKVFDKSDIAPHLRESIRLILEEKLGREKLYCGGLKIQTTINHQMQVEAEISFKNQLKKMRASFPVDGAMICLEAKTGEIKAIIGGYDFSDSKYNRALQAKRQLGSIFKPILYAEALRSGMKFTDLELDEPITIDQTWSPQNHTRMFHGEMTLAKALSTSNNIVAVKTFLKLDSKRLVELAKSFGIGGPFHIYPSLALGCVDTYLKEAVGMFNVFVNNGIYVEPHFIKWVKDELGKKILKPVVQSRSVVDSRISSQVGKVLTLGMERVRKKIFSEWVDSEAMGKTGTTNDARTCWIAAATPEFTTCIYIGCDDNRPLGKNVFAVRTALPIWVDFSRKLNLMKKEFSFDPSLTEVLIDWDTGKISNSPNAFSLLI